MSLMQQARRWLNWKQLNQIDRNILLFTLDTAFQGLMMGGIFNFLTVFAVRLGASNTQASLLTSLPSLLVAFISIPAGQYVAKQTDYVRYTNRVRLIHRGFILTAALLPFIVRDYNAMVITLIVIWTVKSISNALMEPAWMVVASEILPPKRRAQINSVRWTILAVITAIAVFGYGWILDNVIFPLSYQIVFLISFLGGITGMWFWGKMKIPDETKDQALEVPPVKRMRDQVKAFVQSVREPRFMRFELAATILRVALFLPSALYSIYWVRSLQADDLWISWQGTASKVALIAGYIVWGRVISRKLHKPALLICGFGMALYPILTAFIQGQQWLPVIAVLQGFFQTGIDLSFFDTLLSVVPKEGRAGFISVNTSLVYFTAFLGPMLGNYLADVMPIRTIFFIAGGIFVLATTLFWMLNVTED